MRNIEHVISHFDGPRNWSWWLKVGDNYTTADSARADLRHAIEYHQPIYLGVYPYKNSIGGDGIEVHIRYGVGSGPGWIAPNIHQMRHMIKRTELLLAEWDPASGDFICELDEGCNVVS